MVRAGMRSGGRLTLLGNQPKSGLYALLGFLASASLPPVLWRLTGGIDKEFALLAVALVALALCWFRNGGATFEPAGVWTWRYRAWILGRRRWIPEDQVDRVAVVELPRGYGVRLDLSDGESIEIPWSATVPQDARNVAEAAAETLGASAELDLADPRAIAMAEAERFHVRPDTCRGYKRLQLQSERDRRVHAEIRLRWDWSATRTASILDDPDDVAAGRVGQTLRKPLLRPIQAAVGDVSAGVVEVSRHVPKAGALEMVVTGRAFGWVDPQGMGWSAVVDVSSAERSPFTLRAYRGLAPDLAAWRRRGRDGASWPEGVAVAIADGGLTGFTVDVADPTAWRWTLLALASQWLVFRPQPKSRS